MLFCYGKFKICIEIANGGSGIEETGKTSNSFVCPLKSTMLYDVLKLQKDYVFNRDIP